jgi:hypothetical protein
MNDTEADERSKRIIDCMLRLIFETRRLGGVLNPVACEMFDLMSQAGFLTLEQEQSEKVLRRIK